MSARIARLLSCSHQECALHSLREMALACEEEPQQFLDAIEAAAFAMDVKTASRSYRQSFTENYRVLFQQSARLYRLEFWRACLNDFESIAVNGEVHSFSAATRGKARQLRASREELTNALREWHTAATASRLAGWKRWFPVTSHGIFRRVAESLREFDRSWVNFEVSYVAELIAIEAHARKPVELAIALELQLSSLEGAKRILRRSHSSERSDATDRRRRRPSLSSDESLQSRCRVRCSEESRRPPLSPQSATPKSEKGDIYEFAKTACSKSSSKESHRVLRRLAEQVAVLNARANTQGKGRGDLTMEVLVTAADLFLGGEACGSAEAAARHFLAAKVLDGFMGLRSYFASIGNDVMEVDPQLSKNPRLVKALVVWEEAWELGERILLCPEMLQALCGTAGLCAEALQVNPELRSHVIDQDAELFMILPRLVILSDFGGPGDCQVLRFYLPQHFTDELANDLQALKEEFDGIRACSPENSLSRTALVRHAVLGFGPAAEFDGFLRRLERFSMELQRNRPSDWNQCCLVLLQCIEAVML
ncbi:unnamed protein product [Symbiodinium natans]|uniref:Uncharacterized protein n=1 Tax=Symbiodinium natans TaxID=878477 RepID=A0A812GX75_9DINO|nr:unnamed protein product [Symbiodinium natans]